MAHPRWTTTDELTGAVLRVSRVIALAILAVLACHVGVAHAQAWDSPELSMAVDGQNGGTVLATTPGGRTGAFLGNGTVVTMIGEPDGAAGAVHVEGPAGKGWVRAADLAAITDTFMPSLTDGRRYLPVPGAAASRLSLVVDPRGGVIAMVLGEASIGAGAGAPAAPGTVDLLGVAGEGIGLSGLATGNAATSPSAPASASPAPAQGGEALAGDVQKKIVCTAEESQSGATGQWLDAKKTIFAALPSRTALGKTISIQQADSQGNGYGGSIQAPIKDVGPWNTKDPYWTTGQRPQAESGRDMRGRRTNRAGLDLSWYGWTRLVPGMTLRAAANHTGTVNWSLGTPPVAHAAE